MRPLGNGLKSNVGQVGGAASIAVQQTHSRAKISSPVVIDSGGASAPESLRWRHERRWLRAGAEVALSPGFNLGTSVEQRWAD